MTDSYEQSSGPTPYAERIAVLPGDPRIAYRPRRVLAVAEDQPRRDRLEELTGGTAVPLFDDLDEDERGWLGDWHAVDGDFDAPRVVEQLVRDGFKAQLDIVYFANGACCGMCPPHPARAMEIAANPWGANPWGANPWGANPEQLNIVATGKPPMSSAMPAPDRSLPERDGPVAGTGIVIGILDSGLAGGPTNSDMLRPNLLGLAPADLARISGENDVPSSAPVSTPPVERYLDPVAGHGTFIAGIIEQITPGCTMRIRRVFEPEGDVSVCELAPALRSLVKHGDRPQLVNFSFGGTGAVDDGLFESLITKYHEGDNGIVFVASAGNEGTCVDQYPAALSNVIGVGALAPTGPAPWSNYGPWVNASAPGTDLVSSFFASFDGALPPENGLDPDNFLQWATWSGTSFAGPVVVAALAREMSTSGCSAKVAVERVVSAPHLARFPGLGTIVNY